MFLTGEYNVMGYVRKSEVIGNIYEITIMGYKSEAIRRRWERERSMKNRATTDEQKREVIERLYSLWVDGDNKYLRLGQLIGNVMEKHYAIEDYDFISELEDYYGELKKRNS